MKMEDPPEEGVVMVAARWVRKYSHWDGYWWKLEIEPGRLTEFQIVDTPQPVEILK